MKSLLSRIALAVAILGLAASGAAASTLFHSSWAIAHGNPVVDAGIDDPSLGAGDLIWEFTPFDEDPAITGGSGSGMIAAWNEDGPSSGPGTKGPRYGYAVEALVDFSILGGVAAYVSHWKSSKGENVYDSIEGAIYTPVPNPVPAPTPEPTTLLLFGGGLAAAGIARRLRRRS